jgi:hypothetical protein
MLRVCCLRSMYYVVHNKVSVLCFLFSVLWWSCIIMHQSRSINNSAHAVVVRTAVLVLEQIKVAGSYEVTFCINFHLVSYEAMCCVQLASY